MPNPPTVGPVADDFGDEELSILDPKPLGESDKPSETEKTDAEKEQEEKDRIEAEKERERIEKEKEELQRLVTAGSGVFRANCQLSGCHSSATGRSFEDAQSTSVPEGMRRAISGLNSDDNKALKAYLDTQK